MTSGNEAAVGQTIKNRRDQFKTEDGEREVRLWVHTTHIQACGTYMTPPPPTPVLPLCSVVGVHDLRLCVHGCE